MLSKKVFFLVGVLIFMSDIVAAKQPQKVILDSDMVEGFDDGVAMLLLDQSPDIDLLGVTIVAGNTSMPNGVSSGVRQLELTGSSTPIYEGSRIGLRASRHDKEAFDTEMALSPVVGWGGYLRVMMEPDKYRNDIGMDPLANWKDVYRAKYKESPQYSHVYGPSHPDAAGNRDATDFLVDQVNTYPGEIIIAAIGPCTNIAKAILQDPTFPAKVKKIVYMGGAFYVPGNSSAVAEFNWWADPEAARICLRSQWGDLQSNSFKNYGNQVIAGLEVNQNTKGMPQDLYENMVANTWPGIADLLKKKNGEKVPDSFWDMFAVAFILDSSIVVSWNNHQQVQTPEKINGVYVDVEAEMTQNYGRATAFLPDLGPVGAQKAAIENGIDEKKFWNEIVFPLMLPKK